MASSEAIIMVTSDKIILRSTIVVIEAVTDTDRYPHKLSLAEVFMNNVGHKIDPNSHVKNIC